MKNFALFPARVRLDAVDLLEEPLEPQFQRVILGARVELAQEVAAGGEGVVGKGQRGAAEVLCVRVRASALVPTRVSEVHLGCARMGGFWGAYHAPAVVSRLHARGVQHPAIGIRHAPNPRRRRQGPCIYCYRTQT